MNQVATSGGNSKRSEILDIYRGVAILLVLFRHHEAFPFLNKIGWIGVSLFFVLSGYLISTLLFKELITNSKINIKLFYIRRGFKIYPGFYFFTFISALTLLLLYFLTGHKAERLTLQSLIIECVFLQNYFHGFWFHTWSIAVEEHFYLLFPLLLSFFKINTIKNVNKFYGFTCALIVCVLFFRILNFFINPNYDIYRDVFSTHLRIDGLIFGVMIGYDEYLNNSRIKDFIFKYKVSFLLIMILSFLPSLIYVMESPITYTLGFTTISISFSILILLSLQFKNFSFENSIMKFFAFIGTCSYAIYLWQGYILSFLMRFLEQIFNLRPNSVINFIIFLSLSVFAGWFFTNYLEKYFLSLRQKYFPSKTT